MKDEELKAMELIHSKDQQSKREKKPMIHNGKKDEVMKSLSLSSQSGPQIGRRDTS